MSMAFMIAAASRNRDNRGRYAEGDDERRMENAEGNYSRMNDEMEMRRRRDSRGRYMEGGQSNYDRMENEMRRGGMESEMRGGNRNEGGGSNRMEEGGASGGYWPGPHIPPYLEERKMRRMEDRPDGQNPYGGQPEVYRRQEEKRGEGEMRRMADGKTSAGEINYNRPDGGYGNVRYFMHKTDPMNQNDGKEHFEHPRQIGFQQASESGLDKETVMGWVEEMEDGEGVKGGKYTWHQAQQYAMNMGITGQQRLLEFYWAMNAMYSDYAKIAKKFGVDKPDFYACMAKAFIEDPDAKDNKVEEYVRHIVKHN